MAVCPQIKAFLKLTFYLFFVANIQGEKGPCPNSREAHNFFVSKIGSTEVKLIFFSIGVLT